MNATLLRRILTWVAPFVIGYIVKKYDDRQTRKKQAKQIAKQIQN